MTKPKLQQKAPDLPAKEVNYFDVWTRHLKDAERKQEFIKILKGSKTVFQRLNDLIDEELIKLEKKQLSFAEYDKPNWEVKQADYNADRRRLRQFKSLIAFSN